jgi:hypothetical protein
MPSQSCIVRSGTPSFSAASFRVQPCFSLQSDRSPAKSFFISFGRIAVRQPQASQTTMPCPSCSDSRLLKSSRSRSTRGIAWRHERRIPPHFCSAYGEIPDKQDTKNRAAATRTRKRRGQDCRRQSAVLSGLNLWIIRSLANSPCGN